MQPVASGLKQFHAPTAHAAAARECRPVHSCKQPAPDDQSSAQIRSVKKALMQQVVATLRARLEVVVSGSPRVAGLSDDEQASNQLASAVSTALQNTNSAQDVHDSVQEGLQEAASSLQQSGASTTDLDAALGALTDKLNSLFAAFATPATPGPEQVTVANARLVTKEKGVLEIRTQEGDVVKVKFANRTDVRTSTAQLTSGALEIDSSDLSISTRGCARLSVEGDLNADELQAIQNVVQKVDTLANNFFAGNVDEALAKAADLDIDTEQLANVALRLSLKQRVEVGALTVRRVESPVIPPAAPHAPAAAEDPVATAPATPVVDATPVVIDEVAATPEVEVPAPEAAPVTPPAEPDATDDQSPQAVIAKFVAHLLTTFQSTDSETRVSLSFKMKLQLLTSAIEAKQSEDSPQAKACVKKLCDVAETAAAQ
ncbi:MAG: hypothetical protein ABW110_09135 [Steroidobacteraceae bacterium]